MTPQTYAWEQGHPQFDPEFIRDWANFVKENPEVTGKARLVIPNTPRDVFV